jgi:hypothetical protein
MSNTTMHLTVLIAELQQQLAKYGDVGVLVWEDGDSPTEFFISNVMSIEYDQFDGDGLIFVMINAKRDDYPEVNG